MSEDKQTNTEEIRVGWQGWLALIILILMVSGIFKNSTTPLAALDFTNLTGKFGAVANNVSFIGKGGTGAKEGFLQALNIAPIVIFFCGIIDVAQEYGALKASGILFQHFLRILMGIPGCTGLAFVASFTSVDVGAVMTKELVESGRITEDERTIFATYQNAGSALVTNLVTSGALLLAISPISFGALFIIHMVCKVLGANIMRVYLRISRAKQLVESEVKP